MKKAILMLVVLGSLSFSFAEVDVDPKGEYANQIGTVQNFMQFELSKMNNIIVAMDNFAKLRQYQSELDTIKLEAAKLKGEFSNPKSTRDKKELRDQYESKLKDYNTKADETKQWLATLKKPTVKPFQR
jgi:transcription initiation factor IIE alpha subunit